MSTLKARLLLAEDEFFSALSAGGDALSLFEMMWERLLEDIDQANESLLLDADTAKLAHVTSLRLATLADTSADLYSCYNNFTSQLMGDLATIMSELSLSEPSPPPGATSETGSPPPESQRRTTSCKRRSASPAPSVRGPYKRQRVNSRSKPDRDFNAIRDLSAVSTISFPSHDNKTTPTGTTVLGRPRKRRLSDSEAPACPRQAKRLFAGPRLHAVSDSYLTFGSPLVRGPTTTNSVDEPLLDNAGALCRAPSPAFPLIPLDVTLGSSVVTSSPPDHSPQGFDLSAFSLEDSSSSHLDEFDRLLDSLFNSASPSFIPSVPSAIVEDKHFPSNCLLHADQDPTLSDSSVASTPSPPSPPAIPICPPVYRPEEIQPVYDSLLDNGSFDYSISFRPVKASKADDELLSPLFSEYVDGVPPLSDWTSLFDSLAWFSSPPPPYYASCVLESNIDDSGLLTSHDAPAVC